jgi:hypothetical protein
MNLQSIAKSLKFGPPVAAGNLTMHPLLASRESPAGYSLLDEAVAAGFVRVTEVSETGEVPEISITNTGPTPVLVLDGEELVGAKQNRIVNLTILVPAAATLKIPVTCVEAGRWAHRSRAFAASGRAHYASGRAMKVDQVSRSMQTSGDRRADQSAIWRDIDRKAERLQADSPTQAAAAMYERARPDLDAFHAKLQPVPRQVGAVFEIDGVVAGLELFDSAATWRKSMRKIVESYGLDAIDRGGRPAAHKEKDAKRFLASLTKATVERAPGLGLGEDLRFRSAEIVGAALALDDQLVHVLAFPVSS